jgi:hypothetical protein
LTVQSALDLGTNIMGAFRALELPS